MSDQDLYHELLISGFGGQGVVLAGRLLATAALEEGREVVWAPSYGPEMRGGSVHCTIIVSSKRIGSPEVSLAHSLIIMDRLSMDKFADRIKPEGLMVLNSSLVPMPSQEGVYRLIEVPATESAEDIGDPRVANVIMLGAFLAVHPLVSRESMINAMRLFAGRARAHLLDINVKALDLGNSLALSMLEK